MHRASSTGTQLVRTGVAKDIQRASRDKFYAMLDVNRCLYLTSPQHTERLAACRNSYFLQSLLDLCMITPKDVISEKRKNVMRRDINLFEQNLRRNKYFDSGLSLDEERNALIYSILQHIQQQRALVYHSIYSMVTHL